MKSRLPPGALPPASVDAIRLAPPDGPGRHTGDGALAPTVEQVEALIRAVPYGETRSVKDLRLDLADAHGAATACPVATGQCLRQIARAVSEQLAAGASMDDVVPVWRVVDESSPLLHRSTSPARPLALRRRAEAPTGAG